MPTVRSIKQAMSTYELQGGSANMFINDDGLQLIDEDERQARIDFYADNSIGWTARPKHNPDGGFVRKGKFKKVRQNVLLALCLSRGRSSADPENKCEAIRIEAQIGEPLSNHKGGCVESDKLRHWHYASISPAIRLSF